MAKKGGGKPIPKVVINLNISPIEAEELISTLKERFEQNMKRHPELEWEPIAAKLAAAPPQSGLTACHGSNRWRAGCSRL